MNRGKNFGAVRAAGIPPPGGGGSGPGRGTASAPSAGEELRSAAAPGRGAAPGTGLGPAAPRDGRPRQDGRPGPGPGGLPVPGALPGARRRLPAPPVGRPGGGQRPLHRDPPRRDGAGGRGRGDGVLLPRQRLPLLLPGDTVVVRPQPQGLDGQTDVGFQPAAESFAAGGAWQGRDQNQRGEGGRQQHLPQAAAVAGEASGRGDVRVPGDRLQRRQGAAPQGEGVPAGGGGGGRGAPPGHPAAGRPAAGPRRAGRSPPTPPPPPPQSWEGAEEALGGRLLRAVGGRCRGDAGAPRRPGLSGAVEGPVPPARDWPHRPVLPVEPPTSSSRRAPPARFLPQPCGAAVPGLGVGAGPYPRSGGIAGTMPGPGCTPAHGGPHLRGRRVGGCPAACCCPRCHGPCRAPASRARWDVPHPWDPPRPPSCFAEPPARSRRSPSLVALFQPRSACRSPSTHLLRRVYRLSLPLPAPRPPQHVEEAEEGWRGALPARSRHTVLRAVPRRRPPRQLPAVRACPGSRAAGAGPLSPTAPPSPLHFTEEAGAQPPAPAALAPSPLPAPARRSAPRSRLSSPSSRAAAPRHLGRVRLTGSHVAV